VQMQSGTTGINTPRIYNPVKQGHDQDPAGAFIRTWLPELAAVPDAFVHEPWKWPGAQSLLDRRYPAPVVDVTEAARAARDAVWGARKRPGFAATAAGIVQRHASRAASRSRPARRPLTDAQMTLDL
jgi:deoxyribodipyrimidine photo-lyase